MTYAHKGDYKEGDRVVYHAVGASQQISVGIIKDIITHPEVVGDERPVTVKASEEVPRYIIENVNTGKETAYKYENIVRKAEEEEGAPGTMGYTGQQHIHEGHRQGKSDHSESREKHRQEKSDPSELREKQNESRGQRLSRDQPQPVEREFRSERAHRGEVYE